MTIGSVLTGNGNDALTQMEDVKMMDYCARETTACEAVECCERQMSTREVLEEIRKELSETVMVLSNIRLSIEGVQAQDRKTEEPKCLYDEVLMIEHMAVDCMGLSHAILDKLFGNKELH